MIDRVSTIRENPGIRNASWNRPREGVQPIQEIAGAKEWVSPRMQRDDSREGTGLEPLRNLADVPVRTAAETITKPFDPTKAGEIYQYQTEPLPVAPVGNPVLNFQFCILCGASDKEAALLVPGQDDHAGHQVCDRCVERLMTRLQSEIPKRRLRLALERMMQGEVTEAMVAEVEKLSGGKG